MEDKWADLPSDILSHIIRWLANFDDIIVSMAVCKSWQSAISSLNNLPPLPPKFPWLMLADKDDKNGRLKRKTRGFFSLLDHQTYNFNLPEAAGRNCFGTSFGWLLTVGTDLQISLLHPMSKSQLPLPSLTSFKMQYYPPQEPEYLRYIFIRKAVSSSNPWKPDSDDYDPECVVMAIYGEITLLAFARLGSKEWIDVPSASRSFDDIVYYKDKFYAVDCHGTAFVCDINNGQNPEAKAIARGPEGTKDSMTKYLVESSGELLLVSRIFGGEYFYSDSVEEEENDDEFDSELEDGDSEEEDNIMDEEPYVTVGFMVMKLVESTIKESEYKFEWVKVDSLGDQALFVGFGSSFSLPASSFNGCKANCIYFTDDSREFFQSTRNGGGGHDMGVFSMEDGTIKPHYEGQSLSYFSPPLWYF